MTLVVCHCTNRGLVDRTAVRRLGAAAAAAGWRLEDIPDLCAAAVTDAASLRRMLGAEGAVLCGCHERALQAVQRTLGLDDAPVPCIDLRGGSLEAALSRLGLVTAPEAAAPEPPAATAPDAWYPMLDRERCTDCGRCREFCMFGVYAREAAGRVRVAAPLNCKTNCPACARICPQNAIIFAKCPDRAINGESLSAAELEGARIRLDPTEMAAGDLRAKLAARRRPETPLFRPGAFPAVLPGESPPGADAEKQT